MVAKKCDRCGKFYDGYNVRNSEKNPNGFRFLNLDDEQRCFSHKCHDLCKKCMGELLAWWKVGDEHEADCADAKVCDVCGRPITGKDFVYDLITKVLVHETCANFLEHERNENDA